MGARCAITPFEAAEHWRRSAVRSCVGRIAVFLMAGASGADRRAGAPTRRPALQALVDPVPAISDWYMPGR
jgi:hypothetical protein